MSGRSPAALSTSLFDGPIDATKEIVVICRSGARSAQATRQMRAAGLNAKNLAGGVLRWSDEVDPRMPKY